MYDTCYYYYCYCCAIICIYYIYIYIILYICPICVQPFGPFRFQGCWIRFVSAVRWSRKWSCFVDQVIKSPHFFPKSQSSSVFCEFNQNCGDKTVKTSEHPMFSRSIHVKLPCCFVKSSTFDLGSAEDVDFMAERSVLPILFVSGGIADAWNKEHPEAKISAGTTAEPHRDHRVL